ncbi:MULTISPECIES: glycosyltransferase family 2 protein [unclassified Streptomyces]|uniref:glycosyltransferase family 2 protein n=1 Tax=unclassified Streptomyces TaxID=2593676 RepID=UPI002DD95BF0|nr:MULTISPECIES: glycosyltransferase family 2 protein [unclassified Streptomyces]WSA90484.1 glycosyltransferase family 2 protein [Streptomyces sp. NBC_01795]WSB74809.1 glycosyltransferase family 2 protein [Streptomyces sp. NBC_01775]WSS16908.1 glycosyltransferase family 2 protein [Streptomyces sp. NBC_01186]WSS45651.1 glycosyltransferase family 2 protein [Streptomyces sp. NBC_01187]
MTVIVPAHNEEAGLPATLESIRAQTVPPGQVIVVDDASQDGTGEVARAYGVEVLRPPANLGSKAKAQNYALPHCRGDLVLAVDADTVLAPDYIEQLLPAFDDPSVVVAAGNVQTRFARTVWERGRSVEYLFGFHWNRPIQERVNSPMVCSGCCSAFRREELTAAGGFPEATIVEDMDYTWSQQISGRRARYVSDAVAWAADPESLLYLRKQVWRWMAGFCQNVRLHAGELVLHKPMLAVWVLLALVEILTAPLWWGTPLVLIVGLGYPVVPTLAWWLGAELVFTVPPLVYAARRRGLRLKKVLADLPCVYPTKIVNLCYAWKAVLVELVLVPLRLSRGLTVYEKGRAPLGSSA